MKLAVTGKGGVGKTTVAGTLARLIGRGGARVLAVDADPNYNLWSSIGISKETASSIVPLLEDERFVHERTRGEVVRVLGRYFELHPRVDDIVEKFAIVGPENVSLLVAGTVNMGDSGCMCPSAALLKALISHLVMQEGEVLIMDMDAGIENLGRGTTKGMDALLVVVEPGQRSLDTLGRIKKLASDIGTDLVYCVANRVTNDNERYIIQKYSDEIHADVLAFIPDDATLRQADLTGTAPLDMSQDSAAIIEMQKLKEELLDIFGI